MNLVYFPKLCIIIVLDFFWDDWIGNNGYAKFWGRDGGGGYKMRCIMVYVEVVKKDTANWDLAIDNSFFFFFFPLIPGFGLNLMKTSRFTYEMTQNRAEISDKRLEKR